MPSWNKWTITNSLILVCGLIFLAMTLAGGSTRVDVLLRFGAMQTQFVAAGEVWRLLSANLLHIGVLHLLMNMAIYYQFGNLLEAVLKRWQYVIIILAAMFTTTGATYIFDNAMAVSAGFSGVLFGLMGAFIVLAWFFPKRFGNYSREVIRPILILNVVLGFINPSVNWIGHFGGFVGGFVSMFIIAAIIKNKR